ncbi:hypothetical protein M2133_000133 [Parabacteroides sp. PF5-6]|nr:hypothetical protein [Parabacteroides sp. PF5-6]
MVSRAYWYTVPQAQISAEYLFDYTFRNEYVQTIFIDENNSVAEEENTYVIHLEYNYSH